MGPESTAPRNAYQHLIAFYYIDFQMPKRTNTFQSLVAQIFGARKEDHSMVVESSSVSEQGVDTPAEIDIMITKKAFGVTVKIALECRDHARPQTVEWIRELANKRSSMAIDKLFAVSTSGFTKKAAKKAAASGIELMTLKQAEALDIAGNAVTIGMMHVNWRVGLDSFHVELSDVKTPITLSPDSQLFGEDGASIGTIGKLIHELISSKDAEISAEFNRSIPMLYKTRADIGREAFVDFPVYFNSKVVLEGALVRSIKIVLRCVPVSFEVPVSHYSLGEICFAHGTMQTVSGSTSFAAAHWADRPNEISLSIRSLNGIPGGAMIAGAPGSKAQKRQRRSKKEKNEA